MSDEHLKTMGMKIRDLRMKSGRSLQQLADEASVSKPHVYELEHGKVNNPSITVLRRLADIFKVSPAFFLENNENTEFQVMFRNLQKDFALLDPKDREAVELVIQALKARSKND